MMRVFRAPNRLKESPRCGRPRLSRLPLESMLPAINSGDGGHPDTESYLTKTNNTLTVIVGRQGNPSRRCDQFDCSGMCSRSGTGSEEASAEFERPFSMPSFRGSAWIRGSRQSGLSRAFSESAAVFLSRMQGHGLRSCPYFCAISLVPSQKVSGSGANCSKRERSR